MNNLQLKWLNLKMWLFAVLLNDLKQKFVDGTLNFLKVLSVKELLAFTKHFVRRQSFVREIRTVNVKKGKRKYTLLFVTTADGTQRFNLGRHRQIENGFLTGSPVQDYYRSAFHRSFFGDDNNRQLGDRIAA
jgi:hypothetical protein